MQFDEEVDMLLVLGECLKNSRRAAEVYRQRFPQRRRKSHMSFRHLERRTRQFGIGRSSRRRRRLVTDADAAIDILAAVNVNPHVSTRELSQQSGITQTSTVRILKRQKFHPYHISLHQELNENDCAARVHFCQTMLQRINEDPNYLQQILFFDESTFTNTGQINSHNMHYWAVQNPYWLRAVANQRRWSLNGGPHFFNGNLNDQMYADVTRNILPNLLRQKGFDPNNVILQQDDAPAHYANEARQAATEIFPRGWIGRRGNTPWPARSPELTVMNYFLWGCLKDTVYATTPADAEDLRQRIVEASQQLTPQQIAAARQNFIGRAQDCILENGGLFEHLL